MGSCQILAAFARLGEMKIDPGSGYFMMSWNYCEYWVLYFSAINRHNKDCTRLSSILHWIEGRHERLNINTQWNKDFIHNLAVFLGQRLKHFVFPSFDKVDAKLPLEKFHGMNFKKIVVFCICFDYYNIINKNLRVLFMFGTHQLQLMQWNRFRNPSLFNVCW